MTATQPEVHKSVPNKTNDVANIVTDILQGAYFSSLLFVLSCSLHSDFFLNIKMKQCRPMKRIYFYIYTFKCQVF